MQCQKWVPVWQILWGLRLFYLNCVQQFVQQGGTRLVNTWMSAEPQPRGSSWACSKPLFCRWRFWGYSKVTMMQCKNHKDLLSLYIPHIGWNFSLYMFLVNACNITCYFFLFHVFGKHNYMRRFIKNLDEEYFDRYIYCVCRMSNCWSLDPSEPLFVCSNYITECICLCC